MYYTFQSPISLDVLVVVERKIHDPTFHEGVSNV